MNLLDIRGLIELRSAELKRLVEIAKRMQEGKRVASDDAHWAEERLAESRAGGGRKLTRGELEIEVRRADVGRVGF